MDLTAARIVALAAFAAAGARAAVNGLNNNAGNNPRDEGWACV